MNSKKIIILFIIILTILLFIVLFVLLKNVSQENKNIVEEQQVENNYDNTVNADYDKSLYYEENGKLYTMDGDPAYEVNLDIIGVPQEVLDYLIDVKAFYNTVKVYLFSYIEEHNVTTATYSRYEFQAETSRLAIAFILDDNDRTQVTFIVDLKYNTIDVAF